MVSSNTLLPTPVLPNRIKYWSCWTSKDISFIPKSGKALVEAVGAQPLVIDGRRQDYLVGTISHLPYLLACSLVSTADATTSADPLVWQILAGGYRDTSRVAGSDVTMMVDILITNREEVVKAARICGEQLADLADLVDRADEDALREKLAYIRNTRREHYA